MRVQRGDESAFGRKIGSRISGRAPGVEIMSQPKLLAIAALCILACAGIARADPAVVTSRLNLRAGPGPAFGVRVVLEPGTKVDVRKCRGKWCSVKYKRRIGYVSRLYVKFGADALASATSASEPVAPAKVEKPIKPKMTGPRIWRWRDQKWRDRHWRQFGWRYRHRRK
jgi:uncharacterized protein YraI